MQTMNIFLPDPLKEFVDHQIAEGRYSSVSEYIRELIRDDEKRKTEQRLEALLLEGLESEESELTRQDFDDVRKEALATEAPSMPASRSPNGLRKWRVNGFEKFLVFYLPRPGS
jgi:antitoxin ParD1/3/4